MFCELIQHQDLKPVPLEAKNNIPYLDYKSVFKLSQRICDLDRYAGIADNQIPLDLIKEYTGDIQHRHIIFLRQNQIYPNKGTVLEDTLVINPLIKIDPQSGLIPSLEGCGSIDYGQSKMCILRPVVFTLEGYFWHPGMNRPLANTKPGFCLYDATVHEVSHLHGKTALDFPDLIINPFDKTGYRIFRILNPKIKRKELLAEVSSFRKDFYVSKNGNLIKVNYLGQRIK
jgi:hypothetical protein